FHTVDGDFHLLDFGERTHDVGIYSNIAHQESPADNAAVFGRLRRALRPGGALLVSDFVLDGERRGNRLASLFHGNILLGSRAGAIFSEPDYRGWLEGAGFSHVTLVQPRSPFTLLIAR